MLFISVFRLIQLIFLYKPKMLISALPREAHDVTFISLMCRISGAVHNISIIYPWKRSPPTETRQQISSLFISSAGYKGLGKNTQTGGRHKGCKGMLMIGPWSWLLQEPTPRAWLISDKAVTVMLPNGALRQQSELWHSATVWAGFPECTGHGWESQKETFTELETEALCHPSTVHYSDGNNELLTADLSSITRAQCHHCSIRTITGSISGCGVQECSYVGPFHFLSNP